MIDINLIAARRAQQRRAARVLRLTFYGVIGLAVMTGALFAYFTLTVSAAEARISQCEGQLNDPALAKKLARIDLLDTENKELAPRVETLQKVGRSHSRWRQVFSDISASMPTGVWLTGLSSKRDVQGQSLSISGSASCQREVGDFMLNLKASGWANPPELSFTQMVSTRGVALVNFEIKVPLKTSIGSDLQ
jgi:Tfp pilus assembly protein PilN